MYKKFAAIFIAVLILLCAALPAFSQENYNSLELDLPLPEAIPVALVENKKLPAISAILISQNTGEVLFEQEPDVPLPPASITKVMTLLLTVEAIDRGDISLEDMVTASLFASSMGGSQIWLEPGEEMSVQDLLKAVAVSSANDAATALGEFLSGSEEAFVQKMNARAQELGMVNTQFQNSNGLDANGHYSTARDIALMSRELMKHPIIKEYSTIWMDSLRGGKTELTNTNKLVRFYEGCTGLKTGTTSDAGSCLSASAERNGLGVIAVVMGCPTSNDRFASARTLLDYAFANYAVAEIPSIQKQLLPVKVLLGVNDNVPIMCEDQTELVVSRGLEDKIEQQITLVNDVTAPVEYGQKLGNVEVFLNGQLVREYPIFASINVERLRLPAAFLRMLKGALNINPPKTLPPPADNIENAAENTHGPENPQPKTYLK